MSGLFFSRNLATNYNNTIHQPGPTNYITDTVHFFSIFEKKKKVSDEGKLLVDKFVTQISNYWTIVVEVYYIIIVLLIQRSTFYTNYSIIL